MGLITINIKNLIDNNQIEKLMSFITDLNAKLDATNTAITALQNEITDLNTRLSDNPTPEEKTATLARIDQINTTLQALAPQSPVQG